MNISIGYCQFGPKLNFVTCYDYFTHVNDEYVVHTDSKQQKHCGWHFDSCAIVGSDSSKNETKQKRDTSDQSVKNIRELKLHMNMSTCNLNQLEIDKHIDRWKQLWLNLTPSTLYIQITKKMVQLFLYHEHLCTHCWWITFYDEITFTNGCDWNGSMSIVIVKISAERCFFVRKKCANGWSWRKMMKRSDLRRARTKEIVLRKHLEFRSIWFVRFVMGWLWNMWWLLNCYQNGK